MGLVEQLSWIDVTMCRKQGCGRSSGVVADTIRPGSTVGKGWRAMENLCEFLLFTGGLYDIEPSALAIPCIVWPYVDKLIIFCDSYTQWWGVCGAEREEYGRNKLKDKAVTWYPLTWACQCHASADSIWQSIMIVIWSPLLPVLETNKLDSDDRSNFNLVSTSLMSFSSNNKSGLFIHDLFAVRQTNQVLESGNDF